MINFHTLYLISYIIRSKILPILFSLDTAFIITIIKPVADYSTQFIEGNVLCSEQSPFHLHTTLITAKITIRPYSAMAWYDYRERVCCQSSSDRTSYTCLADMRSDKAIGTDSSSKRSLWHLSRCRRSLQPPGKS